LFASAPDTSTQPNVTRWYNHIKSYTAEYDTLPGTSTAGEAFTSSSAAAPAAAADEEEEDEVDLFGSDEEDDAEAERIKAERIAQYNVKKAGKAKTIAKVCPCMVHHIKNLMNIIRDSLL
jgi:elongation factor 1-beta